MLKVGDQVKYRDVTGVVSAVMDDMVIVKFADGKEYSLPYNSVTVDGAPAIAGSDVNPLLAALKPHVKNVNFLNEFAQMIHQAGVAELSIKLGSIQAFSAKESLDEKIARHRAEAVIAAEKAAREEYDREVKSII